MGRTKSGGTIFHHMAEQMQKEKADKARYSDNKIESDTAREKVKAGLDDRASFQPINLDEFAQEKREQARSRRSERRAKREERMKAREERFDKRLEERRRQNEMRKPQQEIGGEIGVLGAPNPYGDDAIWDNNTRTWQPNTQPNNTTMAPPSGYDRTKEIWQKAQDNKPETAPDMPMTNLFGQSKGTNIRSDSPGEIMRSGAELNDNRDFKKLYEELLKIKGGKIT